MNIYYAIIGSQIDANFITKQQQEEEINTGELFLFEKDQNHNNYMQKIQQ